MDLTQGYHQAPLEDNTKAFTAFITFSGVYEFTRLPFGPKRAPSYFQQIMATIVLVGMMCEMYTDDDCIVFANTNEEYTFRLGTWTFQKHNLFLTASKCSFAFKEFEFVGKVVSEAGLKISQQKIQAFSITYRKQTTEEFCGYG